MILFSGRHNVIVRYLLNERGIHDSEITCYPRNTTHYSEYDEELRVLKSVGKDFTTQSKEFIEFLLDSDLDFEIWTVYEEDGIFSVRKLNKSEAKDLHYEMGLELR